MFKKLLKNKNFIALAIGICAATMPFAPTYLFPIYLCIFLFGFVEMTREEPKK